jgi:hypothetical protein
MQGNMKRTHTFYPHHSSLCKKKEHPLFDQELVDYAQPFFLRKIDMMSMFMKKMNVYDEEHPY